MHVLRRLFRFRFLLPFAFLFLVTAVVLSFDRAGAQQSAATYAHGSLYVSIPYHSTRAGSGRLVAEILDPEDHVLGRVERDVDIANGDGSWHQIITPEKPISFEDIVWQRMRYRFEYSEGRLPAIDGIASISQILRRPVVHIIGQTQYLAGSQAAIRVIVSDANNNDAVPPTIQNGTLRIDLMVPNQKTRTLFSGRLNHRGTVEAQIGRAHV